MVTGVLSTIRLFKEDERKVFIMSKVIKILIVMTVVVVAAWVTFPILVAVFETLSNLIRVF